MMTNVVVRIQAEDFDVAREITRISENRKGVGAIVTFSGICRDEDGRLAALELEHYPGMAEAEITRIVEQAVIRFDLTALTAIHRYGRIKPGGNIVLVVAASPHRQAAFDGANFIMDYLKTNAPFWKKEHPIGDGFGDWVAAKEEDDLARERWEKSSGS